MLGEELQEIDDPFALFNDERSSNNEKMEEERIEEHKSQSEDSSSDSDIDIVQKTKQHRINPLEFLTLGKR